ncbi:MAG: V-type ATP synthase subunit E [Marinilabiliaceae bacterium]|nr:V-type ATP synthase subunit E [Marinilabiliaceae bacterium]
MQNKIQELTEKIYNEGVLKAKDEAENILQNARNKAAEIESEAQKDAKNITDNAQKQAQKLKEQVESELKMSIDQAVSALKQELTNIVTMQAIQPSVKEVFTDTKFVEKLIETVVKCWSEKDVFDLKVAIPEELYQEMETFFKNRLSAEMNKGLEIILADGIKTGFKVGPSDDSYQISFTDRDFTNFFKAYLQPKTSELLFEKNK